MGKIQIGNKNERATQTSITFRGKFSCLDTPMEISTIRMF